MFERYRQNANISNNQMETMEIDSDNFIESLEDGGIKIDDIHIPPAPNTFNGNDNQKRLIIKKIVNINFKSYAGEMVIGPFHECFTAIVGPNGSGKSNIIDSMLFVFGYRANKMRSNKVSALIHSSREYPNISSCTVSIHFERILNNLTYNQISSESQIIISRTAFKDDTSFYELNGKRAKFKEIAKFLRYEAVDLDYNRFLILQGEVEQIAMMKPKAQNEHDTGMLEFLEDIIGTSRYKVPLEKLMDKIDVVTESLNEKHNRLRIVENERDQLKAPMNEAVQYIKFENKKTKLLYELYHCKKFRNTVNINELKDQQKELDEDCQKLQEDIENIKTEKKLQRQKMNEQCEKWNVIQDKFDVARAKFEEMKKRDDGLHAELVETNKRRKSNIESVKIEKKKLIQLQSVPKINEELILDYEKIIKETMVSQRKEDIMLKHLMETLNEKTEPFINERRKYETELMSHREKIDKAQSVLDVAESAFKLYISVEKAETDKFNELQETFNTAVQTIKNYNEKLSLYKVKIPATEKTLSEAEKKLEKLKFAETEINIQLKKTRQQIEVQRCAMQAKRSRNKVIDALMEEKTKGRIPGIFGRLGDLGAIDSKYDVAISTACGPLDNVIVDTVNTAQICIQFLRDNGIGRSTFIALEKIQRFLPQCQQKIQTPENVSRLFDLIRVKDKRVLPAFYYGLHDTLVVNDLDQATRIAYSEKRYRVVTLKGELIETSGTMSGGGNTVLCGRMGQSVVERQSLSVDIKKLEQSLEIIYAESSRLKLAITPLENQIIILSSQLNNIRIDRDKCIIELKRFNENTLLLESQLKIQEKKVASSISNPDKIKKLNEAVQYAKKSLENVSQESGAIEQKVYQINQKIDKLSVGRIKEQQIKIMNLNQAIDNTKSEICKLEIAIKTAERNIQKTEQRIVTLESAVNDCEKRIHDIQVEKRQCEIDGKMLLEISEKCGDELMEKDEVSASLKAQWDKLQEHETKLKGLKIDLDKKFKDNEKLIYDLNEKINDYQIRINSLRLNPLPDENPQVLGELTENEIASLDIKTLVANLAVIKEHFPSEIPNMQIIEEYRQKDTIFMQRSAEIGVITEARNKLRLAYDIIRRRRHEEFYVGFSEITLKLKEMYQMITLGGAADLELVDSLDPFTEGIVFSVRPPKKSWKNISNLSGGEKTLSSLALVFALHHYKPTPLYFMDEIDAALDFKNVSIVGTYIKERTKNAQFIVISLRSEMFELADTLVGIYKTHNTTKCTTINILNMYDEHPDLAAHEEERQKYLKSRKLCTQSAGKYTSMSQLIAPTCPARIESLITNNTLKIHTVCTDTNVSSKKENIQISPHRKRSCSINCSLTTTNKSTMPINSYDNVNKKRRTV